MSGIILICILVVWFYLALKLSGFCVSKIKLGANRSLSRFFLCVLFFLAPVADDIAGGFQFRELCKTEKLLAYDESKLKNKSIVTAGIQKNKIEGTFIPIKEHVIHWVDETTKERLLEQTEYYATGGWLSRLIAFNSITRPYTFDGVCGSESEVTELQEKLNFKRIYK